MPFDPAGYWGLPTSTIDWCEQNYAVTPYVAEFFNTVSSLAMVLAGVLGAGRRALDPRLRIAFGLLVLVGLGSIAFHGTLRRELQMLDELPMLYLVTWLVWLLVENGPAPRFGRWFPASLVIYGSVATTAAAFASGAMQFFAFHVTFGALELFCLGRVAWLAFRPANAPVRGRFLAGIGAYALGLALWFVDLLDCPGVSVTLPRLGLPNPQLHAWWHVLVSVGFYLLLGVISFDRIRRRTERSLTSQGRGRPGWPPSSPAVAPP